MYVCVGEPTDDQLQKIRTRKPEAPVIEVDMKDGSKKKLWCTFGAQQIDIDPFSKPGTPALPCPALPCPASLTMLHSALLCCCHVCKVRSAAMTNINFDSDMAFAIMVLVWCLPHCLGKTFIPKAACSRLVRRKG